MIKVIIVADEPIHEFLSAQYPNWDTQKPVTSIEALWTGLRNGELDTESKIVVICDQYLDPSGASEDMELAIASLAPEAMIIVITYEDSSSDIITRRVKEIIARDKMAAGPIYFVHPETPVSDIDAATDDYAKRSFNSEIALPNVAPNYEYDKIVDDQSSTSGPHERHGIIITSTSSKGGSGKCVPMDTTIFDPFIGVPVTMQDVFDDKEFTGIWSFDGNGISIADITEKISNGIKTTYELQTYSGRVIRATSNHPLLTKQGWKSLGEIAVGERIALPRSLPLPLEPKVVSSRELRVLAKSLVSKNSSAADVKNSYRLNGEQLGILFSIIWESNGGFLGEEVVIDKLPSRVCAARIQTLLLRLGVQSIISNDNNGDYVLYIEKHDYHKVSYIQMTANASVVRNLDHDVNEFAGTNNVKDGSVYWDSVVSIKYHGREEVADLEVSSTHNFVANDIIVHNSSTALLLGAQFAHSSRKAVEEGLSARPMEVCVVDMDIRDGQIGFLIGQSRPTALNIRAEERDWNAEAIYRNLVFDERLGIHALLAPKLPRTADDVPPEFYRVIIRELKKMFDVVILDTSVNYLDALIEKVCLPESDAILFVTDLGISSVFGMMRWFDEVTAPVETGGMGIDQRKIGVVINKSIPGVGMDKEKVQRASMGAPLVGVIPLDSEAFFLSSNRRRLDEMLRHPTIGPAYYKLARSVIRKRHVLSEIVPQESVITKSVQSKSVQTHDHVRKQGESQAYRQNPSNQTQKRATPGPPSGAYPGYHTPDPSSQKKKGLFGRGKG